MCGRYLIAMEDEILEMREILDEINERYKDTPEPATVKTGEVCPTDTAPVVIQSAGQPQAKLMKWGFPKPPHQRTRWQGPRQWQGGGVIINARAETAKDKLTFRPSLTSRRCVIPTTGFFEWRHENGKKKTKYLFRLPDTKLLYLAGLYGVFRNGSRSYGAYVILTASANPSVSPYHNRMPLVLMPEDTEKWLRDTSFAYEYVQLPCRVVLEAVAVK